MEKIAVAIKEIIESTSDVTFDRSSATSFDDSGVTIETVYYVDTADYKTFTSARQSITLTVLEKLDQMDIKLAHPVRQVEISKGNLE